MSDLFSLSGQRALVTGASSGLGRHFAGLLARNGAAVALAARRLDTLQDLADHLQDAGHQAAAVAMDVTDPASIAPAFEAAEAALGGPIDILVNNAGLAVTRAALDQTEADWDKVLDTNLKGAFLVAQEAARRMKGAGGGAIVNVASILGLRVSGMIPAYCASKAGLIHLTKALALELARDGVRVNALCPGYIETDLNRDFLASDAGQKLMKRVPQRRFGRPEDLDGALLLMASDAGRYMTGSVIAVDGGHLVNTL